MSVLAISSVVVACSSDEGSSNGNVAPATAEEFARVLAAKHCEMSAFCCSAHKRTYEGKQCADRLGDMYAALIIADKYKQTDGQACLELIAANHGYFQSNCPNDEEDPVRYAPNAEVCTGAFEFERKSEPGEHGTALPGENCKDIRDCAPSSKGNVTCASHFSGGELRHACQVMVEGKLGDAGCNSSLAFTAEKVYCFGTDNLRCDYKTDSCVPLAKPGESCQSMMDCEKGLNCGDGICYAYLAEGESCVGGAWPACDVSFYCDAATSKCTKQRKSGEACTTSNECKTHCAEDGTCAWVEGADDTLEFACPGELSRIRRRRSLKRELREPPRETCGLAGGAFSCCVRGRV